MNTFMNSLKEANNYKLTENGGVAYSSTRNPIYDMFALGAAYRSRCNADVILLFKNALEYEETLALKCLFYIRDCRGGQGERRFFRVAYHWLAQNYPDIARRNLEYLSEYGRWDDLIYICLDTPLEDEMINMVKKQLILDAQCKTPSLLAKWCPSENASSSTTKAAARKLRIALDLTSKEYRKLLSGLRTKINIVEKLMSENRWDEIIFDKIPSKAGLKYKNAFARRDIIAKKYEAFAKDKTTKVNAATLYPYEVVAKAIKNYLSPIGETDRAMIEKYWENLPDYLNGEKCNMICVVDTSGSMTGSEASAPINVAISLGMYCAERIGEPFKNHYISFSSRPQLIEIKGVDFVDKVRRIYRTNLCENTDLTKTFDMILDIAKQPGVKKEDIPETVVVISDMEIDSGSGAYSWSRYSSGWTERTAATEMEKIREKFASAGLECPRLIYWNVNARNDTILDSGPNVSFVSGFSPVLFQQVLTGKSGWDLCLDKLLSARYEVIK